MKNTLHIRPTTTVRPRDAWEIHVVAGFAIRSGHAFPVSRTQRRFLIQIGAAAAVYRTGEKAVAISSLFSCRIGRTPLCGGHAPPGLRDSSRMRARSPRSLYTQVSTNLLSPPSSLVQQAANEHGLEDRRLRCHEVLQIKAIRRGHPASSFSEVAPGPVMRLLARKFDPTVHDRSPEFPCLRPGVISMRLRREKVRLQAFRT